MDVRLTGEQQELSSSARHLATTLGPSSVAELDDAKRIARLEKAVADAGWRRLRSDGASGVEVAVLADEFGRGLVDVPFLGPVLADDLARRLDHEVADATILGPDGIAPDAKGMQLGIGVADRSVLSVALGDGLDSVDLTRRAAASSGDSAGIGTLSEDQVEAWTALTLVTTSADILGAARGALELATDYAKLRQQYGKTIGSYQAVAHLLAESLALLAGATSLLWYAAWAVDELPPAEALAAAQRAKLYCARTGRMVCENAIQVHGGIGNTWECLAHVYLRRVLVSANIWPVSLKEITVGLS